MILALLFTLVLLHQTDSAENKTTLTIGFFIPDEVPPEESAKGLEPMGQVALDEINANSSILKDYYLKYTLYDTKGAAGEGIKMLFKFVGSNPYRDDVAIIGPVYSSVSKYIGELAPFFNYVHVSPTASSDELEDQAKYTNTFRMHPVESKVYLPIFEFIESQCNWWKIHILTSSEDDDTLLRNILQSFVTKSTKYNYTLQQSSFTFNARKLDETFANAKTAVKELKSRAARVIVANFLRKTCMYVFCAAASESFWSKKEPSDSKDKIVWIIPSSYEEGFIDSQNYSELGIDGCDADKVKRVLGNYLVAEFQWNTTSTTYLSTGYKAINIWQNYTEELEGPRYNDTNREDKAASLMYDSVWVLAYALQDYLYTTNNTASTKDERELKLKELRKTAGTTSTDLTKSLMGVEPFEGLSGTVAFDDNKGRRGSLQQLKQYINNKTQIICNYTAMSDVAVTLQCNTTKMWNASRCPLSQAHNARKMLKGISVQSLIVSTILSFVGILLAISFFIFNLIFIKERIIRMSSPHINNIILVGSALLYIYVPLTGFMSGINGENVEKAWQFCEFRIDVWIIAIGFTTSFGALFAKTWRVYAIFTSKKPRNMILSDWKLVVLIIILVTIDVLLLGINEVVNRYSWDPSKVAVVTATPDLYNDHPEVYQLAKCVISNGTEIPYVLYTVYTFKGLLLLFGVFITVQTRKISIPALNDSKYIGVCIYTVVVVCLIGYPVAVFLKDDPQPSFVVKSGCILFTNTIMLCVIFLPKLYQLKYKSKEAVKSQVMRDLDSTMVRRESDAQVSLAESTLMSSISTVTLWGNNSIRRKSIKEMKNLQLEVEKRNSVIQVLRETVARNPDLSEDRIVDIDDKIRALRDSSLVVEQAPIRV